MTARILVINDDSAILELYRMLLEEERYEVHCALAPFERVQEVEQLAPDLIILDIKLGAQALGLTLLHQLKMYPPTAGIAIIICTAALAIMQERETFLRDQDIPLIYKPFDIDELLTTVRKCVATSDSAGNTRPQNDPKHAFPEQPLMS